MVQAVDLDSLSRIVGPFHSLPVLAMSSSIKSPCVSQSRARGARSRSPRGGCDNVGGDGGSGRGLGQKVTPSNAPKSSQFGDKDGAKNNSVVVIIPEDDPAPQIFDPELLQDSNPSYNVFQESCIAHARSAWILSRNPQNEEFDKYMDWVRDLHKDDYQPNETTDHNPVDQEDAWSDTTLVLGETD